MKHFVINETEKFDSELQTIIQENPSSPTYVLFMGDNLPETGKSWCPDCVNASEPVNTNVAKIDNSVLVEVFVGDRSKWKNQPDNFYRKHKDTQLTSIPTLFKWSAEGSKDKLVEEDCYDLNKLNQFLGL